MVRLPTGELTEGKLWKYDLNYNIALVDMKPSLELNAVHFLNAMQFDFKFSQTKMVAIGRIFESGELMATGGKLLYKTTKLDCQELTTSTCKITKVPSLSHLSSLC